MFSWYASGNYPYYNTAAIYENNKFNGVKHKKKKIYKWIERFQENMLKPSNMQKYAIPIFLHVFIGIRNKFLTHFHLWNSKKMQMH